MSETDADDDPASGSDERQEPLGDLARRLRERRERRLGSSDSGVSSSAGDSGDDSGDGLVDRDTAPDSGSDRDGVDAAGDRDPGAVDAAVTGADADQLFEEVSVDDVDADEVWESVVDDADPAVTPNGSSTGVVDSADDDSAGQVVRKREYCEACHFFTDPPEVTCTYDGASITEVVDSEQFRVRNCPVVAGRVDTDGTVLDTSDGEPLDETEDDVDDVETAEDVDDVDDADDMETPDDADVGDDDSTDSAVE